MSENIALRTHLLKIVCFCLAMPFFIGTSKLAGQTKCDFDTWQNANFCDNIPSTGFGILGNNIFCEGETINYIVPASFDIDSAIICWGDGKRTVLKGTGAAAHKFDYPNDTCITKTNPGFITLDFKIDAVLIKNCSSGLSVRKASDYVSVYFPPKADFFAPSVCTDELVPISNFSCKNSANAVFQWWASGANITNVNSPNPSISYPTAGNYLIKLSINVPGNPEGCNLSVDSLMIAVGPPATSVFTTPDTVCASDVIMPINNSQNAKSAQGSPYFWSDLSVPGGQIPFLPGFSATDKEPKFTLAPGTHIIQLSVKGCHNPVSTRTIVVRDKPSVSMNLPTGQCANYILTLDANNCPIGLGGFLDNEMTYFWKITFPGGSPVLTYSTKYPAPILCDVPGEYTVSVSISNGCPPSAMLERKMTLGGRPTADFTFPALTDSCVNKTIQFTSTSAGTGLKLFWQVAGNPSGGATITQNGLATITQLGTYDFILTASNDCPSPNSSIKKITITFFGKPTIDKFLLPSVCEGDPLKMPPANFAYSSGNLPCNCEWTFENGTPNKITLPCNQLPPAVIFSDGQPAKISVKITNRCDSQTETRTLVFSQKPAPDFDLLLPAKLCAPFALGVADHSQINTTATPTRTWTLLDADGKTISTSSAANPTFQILLAGEYSLRLDLGNGCGSVPLTKTFTAFAAPTGVLSVPNDPPPCGSGSPALQLSISGTGGAALLPPIWKFDGGKPATGSGMNPTPPFYDSSGVFPISVLLDNGVCQTTLSQNFAVLPIPNADVSLAPCPRCLPAGGHKLEFKLDGKQGVNYEYKIYRQAAAGQPKVLWKTFNTATAVATISECGIYTCELTAKNLCKTATWTQSDTFYARPSAVVPTFPNAFCQSAKLDFDAAVLDFGCNPALKFWWEFPGATPAQSSDLHPKGIVFSSPDLARTFKFFLRMIGCDGDTLTFEGSVKIDAPEKLALGPDPLRLCKNDPPLPLTADPPGGKWFLSGVEITDGKVHPELLQPGNHIFIYEKGSGACISKANLTATIWDLPTAEAGKDIKICVEKGQVALNPKISAGATGAWSSSHPDVTFTGNTAFFSKNLTATLTFTATDNTTGCKTSSSILLTVLDNSLNPAPPTTFSLCNAAGPVPLPLTDIYPNLRYHGLGMTADSLHFDASLLPAGQVNVQIFWENTNPLGCRNEGSMTINIEALLAAGVLSAGEDTAICQNDSQNFVRSGLPFGNPNLIWLDKNLKLLSPNGSLSIAPGSFQKDTVLMLILAHRHATLNCAQYDTIFLHIRYAAPDPGLPQTACKNDPPKTLLPSNAPPPQGFNGFWTDPAGAVVLTFDPVVLSIGVHYFRYHFAGFGCDFFKEKSVEIFRLPGSKFEILGTTCVGKPIVFQNNTPFAIEFEWYDNGVLFSKEKTPVGKIFAAGQHKVVLKSRTAEGCADEFEQSFFVESAPTLSCSADETAGCGPKLPVVFTYVSTAADALFFEISAPGLAKYVVQASGSPQTIEFSEGFENLTYSVRMLARNECDSAIVEMQITVFGSTTAAFGMHKNEVCSGEWNYLLSKSHNSLADTFELRVPGQAVRKIPAVLAQLIGFQIFTQVAVVAEICLVSHGKCNVADSCQQVLVVPNEFKALVEVNFPPKVCAGTWLTLVGHATPGAQTEWRNGQGDVRFGNSISVLVEPGANSWTFFAKGCGYDSMRVDFHGIPVETPAPQFLPVACEGAAHKIFTPNNGKVEVKTVFSPSDSAFGAMVWHAFELPGRQVFSVWFIYPEGCQTVLDTAVWVQPLAEIPVSIAPHCTPEEGSILKIDVEKAIVTVVSEDSTYQNGGRRHDGLGERYYHIHLVDSVGCPAERTIYVPEVIAPALHVAEKEIPILLGETAKLLAQPTEPMPVIWTPTQWILGDSTAYDPLVRPFQTTIFTVVGTYRDSCRLSEKVRVTVDENCRTYAPNVFKATGEGGENDHWNIYFAPCAERVNLLVIYDYWGEEVFRQEDFIPNSEEGKWFGWFREQRPDPAVFVFFCEYLRVDGKVVQLTGDITLIR